MGFDHFSTAEFRLKDQDFAPAGSPDCLLIPNQGISFTELSELKKIVKERQNEIREHWRKHFEN